MHVQLWIEAVTENLSDRRFRRIQKGFYNLFGFDVEGIDYKSDTNELVHIDSIS
jgi:enoyl-[acyl-carrier protein] reductase/trans-2-enoyl-CoA reductase (NAD+)